MTALERIKEIENIFDREDEPDQSEWIDTVQVLLKSFRVMRDIAIAHCQLISGPPDLKKYAQETIDKEFLERVAAQDTKGKE